MNNHGEIDILAFGAHPDDVELAAGGTILKHIALGKTVVIVDLTEGEMGTRGSREERLKEAKASSEVLGVLDRENLKEIPHFANQSRINLKASIMIPFIEMLEENLI